MLMRFKGSADSHSVVDAVKLESGEIVASGGYADISESEAAKLAGAGLVLEALEDASLAELKDQAVEAGVDTSGARSKKEVASRLTDASEDDKTRATT